MAVKLKPLAEQVVVVIGAASGIGRETALRFGEAGASVLVAARDEDALRSLVAEIERAGGQAAHAVCDVADFAQVEAVARLAEERFGRVDTWVNDAAVAVYARFWDTKPDEFRRVMDVNYMGQIHGTLAALPLLRRQGGALIAISSVESMVSLPLHSAYAASKHAVEGAMDALRREIMAEGWPVSVTSVKPATIDTPLFPNSRNTMDVKPKGPPPYYDPAVVADCVLYAAQHPVRDMYAGGAARMMVANQHLAPGLMDQALSRFGIPASRTEQPDPGGSEGNLQAPSGDSRRSGGLPRGGRRFSLYTWMETHPGAAKVVAGGALAGALLLNRRRDGE
ncbi:SDR family oxidoreductase [Altericroceibacterium xinjiangense]|uniref:SDR family oxidoreductase n=1 Tax=Altericroceibacterium xinjiangense TaxID=762261 RepID=UPI000F7F6F6F|nr:SDR family oxidoreductase [Altericroceibacterium xinjiangense]